MTGYFIYNKKTGKPYKSIPYQTKVDAIHGLKFKYGEPYGIYFKLLDKCGWIGFNTNYEPSDKSYYEFRNCWTQEVWDVSAYHFNLKKFNKNIWYPYFREHFEIRKCNYHIEFD